MDLTKKEILEKLNTTSWASIRTYICRNEFKHIVFQKPKRRIDSYKLLNITENDLERLHELMHRKKSVPYY